MPNAKGQLLIISSFSLLQLYFSRKSTNLSSIYFSNIISIIIIKLCMYTILHVQSILQILNKLHTTIFLREVGISISIFQMWKLRHKGYVTCLKLHSKSVVAPDWNSGSPVFIPSDQSWNMLWWMTLQNQKNTVYNLTHFYAYLLNLKHSFSSMIISLTSPPNSIYHL